MKRLYLKIKGKHICEHKYCLNEGTQCHLVAYSDDHSKSWDEFYWYCVEHCQIEGFCWYCGEFWGGVEFFEFEPTGCCPNCKDSFKADLGEYDEADEECCEVH